MRTSNDFIARARVGSLPYLSFCTASRGRSSFAKFQFTPAKHAEALTLTITLGDTRAASSYEGRRETRSNITTRYSRCLAHEIRDRTGGLPRRRGHVERCSPRATSVGRRCKGDGPDRRCHRLARRGLVHLRDHAFIQTSTRQRVSPAANDVTRQATSQSANDSKQLGRKQEKTLEVLRSNLCPSSGRSSSEGSPEQGWSPTSALSREAPRTKVLSSLESFRRTSYTESHSPKPVDRNWLGIGRPPCQQREPKVVWVTSARSICITQDLLLSAHGSHRTANTRRRGACVLSLPAILRREGETSTSPPRSNRAREHRQAHARDCKQLDGGSVFRAISRL
ncbi:unnamed protein product [Trichogramma brassicae]|uniref:Uncharacterized protein n=1 Tax=Trichogramma brassicae TaxID=86971 RepID=A0A6H5IDU4_9HYME|nr:unnamed protein product [Trichogramma brassicae]